MDQIKHVIDPYHPIIQFGDRNGKEVARAELPSDLYSQYLELNSKVNAQLGAYADHQLIVSLTLLIQDFVNACWYQNCIPEQLIVKIEQDLKWAPNRLNVFFEKQESW